MKVYVLFYDTNYGSREEWTTFYTPCEVFDSPEKRKARMDFLSGLIDEETDEPIGFGFHTLDLDMMTDAKITEWEG
jgi:hypothetical protein